LPHWLHLCRQGQGAVPNIRGIWRSLGAWLQQTNGAHEQPARVPHLQRRVQVGSRGLDEVFPVEGTRICQAPGCMQHSVWIQARRGELLFHRPGLCKRREGIRTEPRHRHLHARGRDIRRAVWAARQPWRWVPVQALSKEQCPERRLLPAESPLFCLFEADHQKGRRLRDRDIGHRHLARHKPRRFETIVPPCSSVTLPFAQTRLHALWQQAVFPHP
jgi:hypothetical protein